MAFPRKKKMTHGEARIMFDNMYAREEAKREAAAEAFLRTPAGELARQEFNRKTLERLKKNPATETRELSLYIENNGDLYRRQTIPIIKNLQRKIAKGVYNPAKALILWKHLADSGARLYAKEFGGPGDKWSQMFSVADRKEVAKELADRYEEHVKEKPMTATGKKRQATRVKTYFSNPRKRGRITSGEAMQILSGLNDDRADFHSLRSDEVQYLLDTAKEVGYRQPKGASGSKARYFYAYLQNRRRGSDLKRNPHRTVPPIKKQRALTNDDLWSAIRGLGMFSKSVDQLIALYNEHKDNPNFASKVIAEAAKQVAITKGAKVKRK
jgi:hypothetical protein